MNIITITSTEYKKLLGYGARKPAKTALTYARKVKFLLAGFGIFKALFGKAGSVIAVNKMRKSWRI